MLTLLALAQDIREITFREYGVTDISPAVLLFTLVMGCVTLAVRRQDAIVPLALVLCLIPVTNRIVVASLDFTMVRITILFVWLRLFARGEIRPIRWLAVDRWLFVYLFLQVVMYVVRVRTLGAVVYQCGLAFDVLGTYVAFRFLLRSPADLVRAVQCLAWISAGVGAFMVAEQLTARNLFAVLGGVPWVSDVRDSGALRARGAFAHPIMAGTFGAVLMPLFVGLWRARPRLRRAAGFGTVGAVAIAATSGSSGPLMALAAGAGCWVLWRWRRHVTTLRRLFFAGCVFVHFYREKPIWHLIGRVSSLLGGTGWHRTRLIQGFVDHWREWFVCGTGSTAHWGWGLQDLTNQFVLIGVRGGILPLVAFVGWLVASFRAVGDALRRTERARRRRARGRTTRPFLSPYLVWGLGACLVAHIVSFISVSYFGQLQYVFYLTLALVAASQAHAVAPARARVRPRRAARALAA